MVEMEIKSMYRKPLQGNKPIEVRIDVTYKDGERVSVVYTPAMVPERYGTNPHQLFTLFAPKDYNFRVREAKPGKAFSLTNIEDSFWAAELLKFMDEPCCVVMKHENPCGAASNDDIIQSFLRAWYCDFRAAFGGVVGFNKPVTRELAQLMTEMKEGQNDKKEVKYFIEVIAAPDYEEGALNELEKRKDLRALLYENLDRIPKYIGDAAAPVIKTIGGMDSMLAFEDRFLTRIRRPEDFLLKEYTRSDGEKIINLGVVTEKSPTKEELENLRFSWYATAILRSNSTAIVKDGCLISPGTGQQARVASVVESIRKVDDLNRLAEEEGVADERRKIFDYSLKGSVLASEALFPYPDSVEAIGPRGITAIAQTGGSNRDEEVITAANKYNIAMIFTGERCFSHH
jgi:phosphoribosylaminoimidazolecarboxamide formyltransferase/IMP cyclohydrolase